MIEVIEKAHNDELEPTPGNTLRQTFENQVLTFKMLELGCVAQSVGHLTKSGALGSIPGLATYFFSPSPDSFKKGSCQLLAEVCAGSTV